MPSNKIRLSERQLLDRLFEQIGFLERSCRAFDEGYMDEAARLALTIRILVHEGNGKSLLALIKKKGNILYLDTCSEIIEGNLLSVAPLTLVTVTNNNIFYKPILDRLNSPCNWVSFNSWWKKIVLKTPDGAALTREKLILGYANKDGGAHVDHSLDETFYKMKYNWPGWVSTDPNGAHVSAGSALAYSVRQISHELQKTLDKYFERQAP